jgi:hypothetical protein
VTILDLNDALFEPGSFPFINFLRTCHKGIDAMDKLEMIILSLILIVGGGCRGRIHKNQQKRNGEFYAVTGGWDWIRMPLLKPYAAIEVDPKIKSNGWGIRLMSNLYKIDRAKKVSVQDSIIYVISGEVGSEEDITAIGTHNYSTAWFILDTRCKTEKGFASESQFAEYIIDQGYPAPKWYDLDSLAHALSHGEEPPWFPK